MSPTLEDGDRLLVWRTTRARPGDLVVVRNPGAVTLEVVKRVTAVSADGLLVEGDNPAASTDSRSWGPVPWSLLVGRVHLRYAPDQRAGRVR